ncbi:MAG: DUF7146 domain-containing protein [Candidatus Dormibacteria bacterium]
MAAALARDNRDRGPSAAVIQAGLVCGRYGCACAASVRRGAGLTHCPAHPDEHPSLSVADRSGQTVVHCFTGCSQVAVLDALRSRGLWGGIPFPSTWGADLPQAPAQHRTPGRDRAKALIRMLWAEALPDHPRLTAYLQFRGLSGAAPPALRLHPHLPYVASGQPRQWFPVMLGCFLDAHGEVVGLHRTFLDPSGPGKARVPSPKRFLGRVKEAAIHLGEPIDGRLGVAEGIETGIAIAEARDTPMWVAGSAGGLAALELPPGLRILQIWADPDPVGRDAAARLVAQARRVGVRAEVFIPHPDVGS